MNANVRANLELAAANAIESAASAVRAVRDTAAAVACWLGGHVEIFEARAEIDDGESLEALVESEDED